ncbi:MAG: hypothetical protein ACI89J_004647 [Hyphomicrobiaceae bacterium]|jgi:hypothetical protein
MDAAPLPACWTDVTPRYAAKDERIMGAMVETGINRDGELYGMVKG